MEPLLCPCQNKRNKLQNERIDDCAFTLVAGKNHRYIVYWKETL